MRTLFVVTIMLLMAGSPLLANPTHLWDCGPYPETSPGDTPQEKLDIKLSWARGFSEAIKEADPEGTLFMSGWFLQGADWTPGISQEFFRTLSAPYFVADLWFDKHPVYEKCDYFRGVGEWGLGVVHTFGNVESLHGNLQDLIDRTQAIVADPNADKLTGFYISPESIHHNFLYYDLVTELAWNPKGVTLDDFLRRYSIRRYGKESALEMAAVWKLVAQTVYGDNEAANPTPTYQDPLPMAAGSPDTAFTPGVKKRVSYIPKLRKAVAMAEHAATQTPRSEGTEVKKKWAIDLLDDCVIGIPAEPSWIEVHVAEELQKYVEAMSGVHLAIAEANAPEALNAKNLVTITTWDKAFNDDAFAVKTIGLQGKNILWLGGNRPRSILYAVYDFLEKECGVGFFEDGDHIPKHKTLRFEAIDRTEKPYFARRVAPSPCAYTYTAQYWGVEEWKTQVDYMTKRKLNTFYWTIGMGTVQKRTWKKLGYEVPEPTEWELWHEQLQKEVRAYAEALDMDLVGQLWPGGVTEEFAQAHPEIRYLTFRWLDSPLSYFVHPADPAFKKIMRTYVKEWEKTYGSVQIWDQSPWSENYAPPPDQKEAHEEGKIAWAKAFSGALTKIAPDAMLFMSSWFMQNQEWPEDVCERFYKAMKTDNFITADVWADLQPTYKRTNYYSHRGKWLFGVLNTFGNVDQLHGNLFDLIVRVKNAATDTQAAELIGLFVCPESFHHNFLLFDLATELAWDPRSVELEDFLRQYCVRRYGRYGAEAMLEAWKIVSRTVYGENTEANPTPTYQIPLGDRFSEFTQRRTKLIHVLFEGLKLAEEKKESLAENRFYKRDLIDIKRTLLGLWFDYHALMVTTAFTTKNQKSFEENADIVVKILENTLDIISTCPDFYLEQEVQMAAKRPKASDPHHEAPGSAQQIRQRYTSSAGMPRYPSLLDYARADRVELLQGYYIPRVKAWIDHIRDCMETGCHLSYAFLLHGAYKDITQSFIETGEGVYEGNAWSEMSVACPQCAFEFEVVDTREGVVRDVSGQLPEDLQFLQ